MRRHKFSAILAIAVLVLGAITPAFAVSKEIIQLQTQVQSLTDEMARMQQSFDERMGVMRNLIEQSTDSMNKLASSLDTAQKSMQQQSGDAQGRSDQLSGQVQSLHDSLDELKARLAKISQQLDAMSGSGQNLPPQSTAVQPPASLAPPPDVLYNNALRDYNAGRYDLASQQFGDYLKFYANTDLAGNAQFYLAEIEYRQGNFESAVRDYDKVLEQYPGGNKAPASQLKKGYALLELGQRDAGVRELNSLLQRSPRSIEATQARERLKKLGAAPGKSSTGKPSAAKTTP
jgi:tol-pal system protein YbgF